MLSERKRRPIIPGGTYFITGDTYRRQRWLVRPEYAQIVVDQWRHYEVAYEFDLAAYCVLPDHYHVVLNVGQSKTISQILHAVNSYVATLISEQIGRRTKAKVFAGEAWDEVIRDEDMYWEKVAYVLLNPWRLGLVRDPLDSYAFSNIDEWRAREGEEFLLELFSRYRRQYE
jgi:putative transposase